MNKIKSISIFILCIMSMTAQAQKIFSNLEELLDYAQLKNIALQQGGIRLNQALRAKQTAVANIIDPMLNTNSSYTNNTTLPVNLFPAEAFGGPKDTYTEVRTGVQYVTNLNQQLDIKLLNLGAWESLKLAKINIEMTSSDNLIALKNLHDNIASAYFNIVNLQEQQQSTQLNIAAAEKLLNIAQNKYAQGLVKQQDVNDAKASLLTTQESSHQLGFLIQQNILSIKILCDISADETIEIKHTISKTTANFSPKIEFNDLNIHNNLLKEKYALQNIQQLKKGQLPTLSFVAANTFQKNNEQFKLFDNDTKWITSNYVGLKLSMNLPSVRSMSQVYSAKYDYALAQKNTEHSKMKSNIEFQQLETDYKKTQSQATANKEIYALRKDTYEKNQQLYAEGLIGIDQTINSYNAMVNANYNLISAQINSQLAQSKIDINNKIK